MSKNVVQRFGIVLLHGWGGSTESLLALEDELKKSLANSGAELKTLRLELPGFGITQLPKVFGLGDYAAYVQSKISEFMTQNELATSEIVLVGHSVGGKIFMKLLAAGGELSYAQLVLINASGLKPQNSKKVRLLNKLTQVFAPLKSVLQAIGLYKLARKVFYKFIVRARDYEKAADNPALKTTFQNVIATHISDAELAAISNPTLLIWGAADKATPLWMGEYLAAHLGGGSELKVVPEATHGLPLKQPAVCAQLIQEFLLAE